MTSPSVVIGVAHAEWAEGRAEGLERLLDQLKGQDAPVYVQRSTEREHAQTWAVRLWQWAAEQDADAAILLNDDVDVSPDLVEYVRRAVVALPEEVLSLHCQLPVAKSLAEAGIPYLRSFWCSGPAYVLQRGTPGKLVDFVAKMPQNLRDRYNEDGYCILWSWGRRRPIWHLLPSPVQHRVEIPSTLGYDNHTLRTAVSDWRSYPVPADATVRDPAPFFDNPWMPRQNLLTLEAEYDYHQKPAPASRCWWCQSRPCKFRSAATGAGLCGTCISECVKAAMG